jgi:hypothetical protein
VQVGPENTTHAFLLRLSTPKGVEAADAKKKPAKKESKEGAKDKGKKKGTAKVKKAKKATTLWGQPFLVNGAPRYGVRNIPLASGAKKGKGKKKRA